VSTPEAPFSTLRLRGGRYEGPGLPLEALPELARYERLVVDVARGLWKQDHPERQRAPRGFAARLQLRLTRIDDGSVVPVLERGQADVNADALVGEDQVSGIFEDARDLLEETFLAITQGLDIPARLPLQAIAGLTRFGSSLRENERIEFRHHTSAPIVYSQGVRRRLLARTAVERFDVEAAVAGRVTGLDLERQTFVLTDLRGRPIDGSYEDEGMRLDFLIVLDTAAEAPVVRVGGRLTVTAADEVERVSDVTSVELYSVPDAGWGTRLLQLAHLRDGWLDGAGRAPSFIALDAARDLLLRLDASNIQDLPGIFPMEDGGVQLEWASGERVVSIEVSPDFDLAVFGFRPGEDVVEKEVSTLAAAVDAVETLL
jgi:hypothetical protein